MNVSEDIKKELKSLLDNEERLNLILLAGSDETRPQFGLTYQYWYSRAYKIVESLAPERLQEFASYYLIDSNRDCTNVNNYVIQDYIKGIGAVEDQFGRPKWNPYDIVKLRILNQMHILMSLSLQVDSVLRDITGRLLAQLQDSELTVASQLKKVSKRAAGVVLERHLQQVTQNHNICIRKKSPTISDLNNPLKETEVYDNPTWRKIQQLADIRNLCVHQKGREPTSDEIDELISGVNSVIKSIL